MWKNVFIKGAADERTRWNDDEREDEDEVENKNEGDMKSHNSQRKAIFTSAHNIHGTQQEQKDMQALRAISDRNSNNNNNKQA